jgi:TM2 domain-containing membrane protein YozV
MNKDEAILRLTILVICALVEALAYFLAYKFYGWKLLSILALFSIARVLAGVGVKK